MKKKTKSPKQTMTQTTLQALLERYQRQLRLLDWDISVEFCSLRDMPDNAIGCIRIDDRRTSATMRILRPEDWSETETDDIDGVIVHELLHIILWPLRQEHDELIVQEKIINRLEDIILGRTK